MSKRKTTSTTTNYKTNRSHLYSILMISSMVIVLSAILVASGIIIFNTAHKAFAKAAESDMTSSKNTLTNDGYNNNIISKLYTRGGGGDTTSAGTG